MKYVFYLILILSTVFTACKENTKTIDDKTTTNTPKSKVQAPIFSADSAYNKVAIQVSIGPRYPNSKGHKKMITWLSNELHKTNPDTILHQVGSMPNYQAKVLPVHNIMARFNVDKKKRILLCAHYDTRSIADEDTSRQKEPILGADDAASGVAVLLELARLFSTQNPNIGIDMLFIDTEDQGPPSNVELPNASAFWCLGAQFWAKNIIPSGYSPSFGILLDMVGAKGNTFTMEGTSTMFAADYMKKFWDTGNNLGYSSYFLYDKTSPITDDHLFINQIARIPMFDVINYRPNEEPIFGKHWHTHRDNLDIIDRNTLKAVGQTLTQFIYNQSLEL